jgi:hypothetical protein
MRKANLGVWLVLMLGLLAGSPSALFGQGDFESLTGKAFDSATAPGKDFYFYLEGNAIPAQERNAALLKTPAGARVLLGLLDTTGYSSQIRQKYIGMLITEGKLDVCGESVGVGSYGFGLDKPAPTSDEDAKFLLYNQAGEKLLECSSKKDTQIKLPKPLRVVLIKGAPARLYLGRYWLELK